MQTVLVTGATGFVGSALLTELLRSRKYQIRAAVRRHEVTLPAGVQPVLVGNLEPETDWSAALEGVGIVIHCAARVHVMKDVATDPLDDFRKANVAGTMKLARQAVDAGVRRFVFISSVKVNGEGTAPDQLYTADDPPRPVDSYAVSKLEAEESLLALMAESGMEVVILRPPLVYGPGVKANFLRLLRLVQKGIPLPFKRIRNLRSMIFLGNLLDFIKVCLEHPKAAGQIFLVSDGQDISTPDLVYNLAAIMGRKVTLVSIPPRLLRIFGTLIGRSLEMKRLVGSLRIDLRKNIELLAWKPPYSLRKGLQETVDWYLGRG